MCKLLGKETYEGEADDLVVSQELQYENLRDGFRPVRYCTKNLPGQFFSPHPTQFGIFAGKTIPTSCLYYVLQFPSNLK